MIKSSLVDVENLLLDLGLKTGDKILIHADLRVFGLLEGNGDGLISVIEKIVGKKGILCTPSFTFSFPGVFDIHKSISKIGSLTNLFRNFKNVLRVPDGMTSFYIVGDQAPKFIESWDNSSYGINSIIGQLHQENGKVLQFGTDILSPIHYLEECVGVPYRDIKRFEGLIINENQRYNSHTDFYARNKVVKKIIPDPIRAEFYSNVYQKILYNNREIRLFSIRDFMNFAVPRLDRNKLILIED